MRVHYEYAVYSGIHVNICVVCATVHHQQRCCISNAAASAKLLHQLRWLSTADCGTVTAEHHISKGSNWLGNESKVTAPTWQVLGN